MSVPEQAIVRQLRTLLTDIEAEHELRVTSVRIDWIDTSSQTGRSAIPGAIDIEMVSP